MFKNKKSTLIKSLTPEQLEELNAKVYNFVNSGDDMYCDKDSVVINFFNDGKIQISGNFIANHFEDIEINI